MEGVTTLPSFRQIIETGLDDVKAQSKRAGLPTTTLTLAGGVVKTGMENRQDQNHSTDFYAEGRVVFQPRSSEMA